MTKMIGAETEVIDRPYIYVLQSRRRDAEHKDDAMPWYVQRFDASQKQAVYTTDVKDAQTFSSLISADSYAIALDGDNPEYHHVVDVLRNAQKPKRNS